MEESGKIGMEMNAERTQLMCISNGGDAVLAYITIESEKKVSENELKICGYKFGNRPSVSNQVNAIEKRKEAVRSLRRIK